MEYKKVVLKSCNPNEYPDLEITCKVLQKEEIGEYLSQIPDEKKCVGTKVAPVTARVGVIGEVVKTVLTVVIEGRKYILDEEEGVVKERDGFPDVVVTNIASTSNEQYIVRATKFETNYEPDKGKTTYSPKPDPRVLTEVPENVVIMTAWGKPCVCLKGGYIVTYNAEECDYNVLERGAKEATYVTTPLNGKNKALKKNGR